MLPINRKYIPKDQYFVSNGISLVDFLQKNGNNDYSPTPGAAGYHIYGGCAGAVRQKNCYTTTKTSGLMVYVPAGMFNAEMYSEFERWVGLISDNCGPIEILDTCVALDRTSGLKFQNERGINVTGGENSFELTWPSLGTRLTYARKQPNIFNKYREDIIANINTDKTIDNADLLKILQNPSSHVVIRVWIPYNSHFSVSHIYSTYCLLRYFYNPNVVHLYHVYKILAQKRPRWGFWKQIQAAHILGNVYNTYSIIASFGMALIPFALKGTPLYNQIISRGVSPVKANVPSKLIPHSEFKKKMFEDHKADISPIDRYRNLVTNDATLNLGALPEERLEEVLRMYTLAKKPSTKK